MAAQPDALPTNKVIAFALASVAVHHGQQEVLPVEVVQSYGVLIEVAISTAVAWFVPDRLNNPKEF